ncbi:MAG: hypothetical protein MN733_23495 [Nitrososphaera sp.]|nr:hypothetical protein [Nitrososphaera sp.]
MGRRSYSLEQLQERDFYFKKRQKFELKKQGARQQGIPFTLSFQDVVWPTHCPIFNVELDYFAPVVCDVSPSFDRVDPNRGYEPGNVQIISNRANRMKSNSSIADVERLLEWMKSQGLPS